MVPKKIVEKKLQTLKECESILEQKDGDKELESKLGVKIEHRYSTLQFADDPLPGDSPKRQDKSYFDKKKEYDSQEQLHKQQVSSLLQKLHEDKKMREKHQKIQLKEKEEERTRWRDVKSKLREEKEKREIEDKR